MDLTEKRLISLEEKFSYQDELVGELNLIVAAHEKVIHRLMTELQSLRESSDGGESSKRSAADDKPPHY